VISGLIPEKVDGVSTAPELCSTAELRAESAAQQIAGGVPANACSEEPFIYTDYDRQPKARAITCGGGRPGYYWVDDAPPPPPPGGADGGQDGGTAPPPGGGTGGQDDGGPLPPPITEMP
jgi:hypothetical protein